MWDFGNRAAVVLTSVTCGCLLVYNAWGTILALAFTLLLVVYACYSLLANDSLVSPHAYHVFGYLREAVHELGAALGIAYGYGIGHVRKLWHSARRCYRERFPFRMDRRRTGNYQLSSDSYATAAVIGGAAVKRRDSSSPSSSSASRFSLIDQLSPIAHVPYRSRTNDIPATDDKFYAGDNNRSSQQLVFGKHTSTPVFRLGGREGDARNGNVSPVTQSCSSKKIPPTQNHMLNRGENITQFSPEGSPWGMSISPKMRPRPAGVKTVQTVAGPLLASTRYNIDPKVYTDVSSPGLTTRLTKYATETKSKLTHQSQYGTWQFPKVNLHANPVPVLNAKSKKMRMPVTVRVAPPDTALYSPLEKQKILSNICHVENKSPTSVVQVLREISLKRHASTEDVSFDIAKKQKTDGFFIEERETIHEENKQKRSRDESSKSDEDLSPQSKSIRPAKRTKTRSCYDILNSFSSSIHVTAGVKRKAVDISRSGTPDFEKHFKSLESAQPGNPPAVSQPQNLDTNYNISEFKEIYSRNPETLNSKKTEEFPLMKGILKSSKESRINLNEVAPVIHKTVQNTTEIDNTKPAAPIKSVKLIEKLFMRAESKRNEQLKVLMEEPGNVKANFATDNVEEIKKEDIRNMRQTSMKARLQSMFDAISGKAENRINPDVVIQADDVSAVTLPVTSSVSCATLSCTTTTTNVNTTPLSTTAIVPSGFSSTRPDTKADTKSAAACSSPNVASPAQLEVPATNNLETKEAEPTVKMVETIDQAKAVSTAPAITNTASLQKIVSSTPNTTPTFTFGKTITEAPVTTSNSSLPSFSAGISSSNSFTPVVTTTPISSTSINFLPVDKAALSSAFVPINPSTTADAKIETNSIVTTCATISLPVTTNTLASSTFTFSSGKSLPSLVTPAQTSASSLPVQTTGTTLLSVNATGVNNIAGFNSVSSSGTSSSVVTTSAAMPLFVFGNSSGAASQLPKSDSFVFNQSGNNVQSKANTFSSSSSSQQQPLPQVTTKSFNFMSNTSVTTVASNSFTNTVVTATPAFGLSSASTFSLSASTTPSTSTPSTSKPLFVFGASNVNTTSVATVLPATTISNTSGFGTMSNSRNAVPVFGAVTTTTVPQFGVPTTTVSQFGTSTTSIFVTTPNTTTNTNIFGTANNSQPPFGAASAASGITGIFNNSTTTTPSIFAPTTNVSSPNSTASSSLFSNVNVNSTTAAPSVFGSGTPIFGQPKPSTSFGTAAGGIFGSTTTSLFGSTTQTGTTAPTFSITGNVPTNTTAPTFGITGNVSTSNTITPGFNSTNNTTPAFGAPFGGSTNSNTSSIQQHIFGANVTSATGAFGTSSVTNAQTSAFGGTFSATDNNASSSVPIFGASATSATGAFGTSSATNTFGTSSATNTFGTQNPTSLTFGGAASGGATFGDNKSPFGATPATTTSFGASGPSVPTFGAGNTSSTSNNTNSMFVFGSGQKDGQQSTTFSFGSNFNAGSNNSTVVSSTPFQFGPASSKPAATGFNFTTPSTTPTLNFGISATPTFNPSTPGMFSIGSGSTAPRSRTIRTRKPR